jgi:hypothetical protein
MKNLLYLVLMISLPAFFYCQDIPKDGPAKEKPKHVMQKRQSSINFYYGTNLLSGLMKRLVVTAEAEGVVVTNFGPVGLMYEYMVTDEIGVGIEGSYSSTNITFYDQYYDGFGQSINYDYNYNITFIRAMGRMNYHFSEDKKFDAYGFISAGYRYRAYTISTNDPLLPSVSVSGIPFGVKPGVGLRYFFVKNFGLNVEFAAGTPLIGGGISLKF